MPDWLMQPAWQGCVSLSIIRHGALPASLRVADKRWAPLQTSVVDGYRCGAYPTAPRSDIVPLLCDPPRIASETRHAINTALHSLVATCFSLEMNRSFSDHMISTCCSSLPADSGTYRCASVSRGFRSLAREVELSPIQPSQRSPSSNCTAGTRG